MNLLTDNIFTVRTRTGSRVTTLPGLFELMGQDPSVEPTAIAFHQRHLIQVFLAQLAAIALHRAGADSCIQDEASWGEYLSALTTGHESFWSLAESDYSKPAFMQPAFAPSIQSNKIKDAGSTPDAIDTLSCAKNHDVKMATFERARPEHWVYALICGQTAQGYSGAGNYGSVRINSGLGNRAIAGVYSTQELGAQWQTDVTRLLKLLGSDEPNPLGYKKAGIALVACVPWDGIAQLSLSELHPLFIESCRMLRLEASANGYVIKKHTSAGPRIAADVLKGAVDDPWTPVKLGDEPSALTLSERGWTPSLVSQLLLEKEYALPASCRYLPNAPTGMYYLQLTGLTRGQGKTAGFHHLTLEIPHRVARSLFAARTPEDDARRIHFANLLTKSLECADMAQKSGRVAIARLVSPNADKPKFDTGMLQTHVGKFYKAFSAFWTTEVYEFVLDRVDMPLDDYLAEWTTYLVAWLTSWLQANAVAIVSHKEQKFKAQVLASQALTASLRKSKLQG